MKSTVVLKWKKGIFFFGDPRKFFQILAVFSEFFLIEDDEVSLLGGSWSLLGVCWLNLKTFEENSLQIGAEKQPKPSKC
jgi:hypothetical protein